MITLTRSATKVLRGGSLKRATSQISRRSSFESRATPRDLDRSPSSVVPETSGGSWAWPRPADNPTSVLKPSPSEKVILRQESGASEPPKSGPRKVHGKASGLEMTGRGRLRTRTSGSPDRGTDEAGDSRRGWRRAGGGWQRVTVPLGEGIEEDHDDWSDDDDKNAIVAAITENIKRYGIVSRHGDAGGTQAGIKNAAVRLALER